MKRKKVLKVAFLLFTLILSLIIFAGCSAANEARSVTGAKINQSGELILSYSDGSEENLGAVVGKDGAPGKDGADGKDGTDGEDGIPGIPGKDGEDGYTPQKGVDYFDGKNGSDGVSATHSWNGTTLTVTSASGTSSANLKGDPGKDGDDGYTPVKGTDYWTPADRDGIIADVLANFTDVSEVAL